jgi:hypothetical protein
MTHSSNQSEPVVTAAARCGRCGYALRGLSADGVCPECGTALKDSLRGALLRYADPDWLHQILRGLRWVQVGRRVFACGLVGLLGLVLTGLFVVQANVDTALEARFEAALAVGSILLALTPFVIGIGLWMLSAPEPRYVSESADSQVVLFRVFSALAVPMMALGFVLARRTQVWPWPAGIQEGMFHLCIAVIWMHMALLVKQAMILEARFESSDDQRMGALARRRSNQIIALIVLLALYWIGWLRWSRTGSWTLPASGSKRLIMYATFICWYSSLGTLTEMVEKVRLESRSR